MPCPTSACRITTACPCTPPMHPTARSSVLRGINEGSRNSPVRSAPHPWPPRGDEDSSGFPLGLRTPPLPAAHAKGGARQQARARDYTTDITPVLLTASPLAKCDIVSQRQIRKRSGLRDSGRPLMTFPGRIGGGSTQGTGRSTRRPIPNSDASSSVIIANVPAGTPPRTATREAADNRAASSAPVMKKM